MATPLSSSATPLPGLGRAVGALHDSHVLHRRVRVIAGHLARALPPNAVVLDVGCGDGLVALALLALRPDVQISGIDVLVRDPSPIPVQAFDGFSIPYPAQSVDAVLLIDVLHHAAYPDTLLSEAARVTRGSVLLKDHYRAGLLAGPTLRAMDWVGNARHGVRLPYTYWTPSEWHARFSRLQLRVAGLTTRLGLYPWPANLWFDRSLHFLADLRPVHSQV